MKTAFVVALLALTTTLMAGTPPGSGKGSAHLEKLKSLVGDWKGTDKDGKPVSISYRMVSDGKSLMETIGMGEHKENMVTIYHLDGENLMLTHYCSAGNQPRMRVTKTSDENKLGFSFMDVTNVSSPDDAHMRSVVFTFKDHEHFSQEWTMRSKGKDAPPVVFTFERAK